VSACFIQKAIPQDWRSIIDIIDFRFFYFDRTSNVKTGHHACGLIRRTVATSLLGKGLDFNHPKFLNYMVDCYSNMSVVRFLIEYAILSEIQLNGLKGFVHVDNSMAVTNFIHDVPDIETKNVDLPVLYRPARSNYKAIDAAIVHIESPGEAKKRHRQTKERKRLEEEERNRLEDAGETGKTQRTRKGNNEGPEQEASSPKPRVYLFPLQITVAKHHDKSHEMFFNGYDEWKKQFDGFDVVTQFIWISNEPTRFEEYDESKPQSLLRFEYPQIANPNPARLGPPPDSLPGWPKHIVRNICLKDIGMHIWNKYQEVLKRRGESA
jgi:hypothetical protein